ncbi:MAG: hypothetical protein OXG35_22695 [Acidobacteria bacterium]|nr:hypothetical protein [Acidobacteriota bacterium]
MSARWCPAGFIRLGLLVAASGSMATFLDAISTRSANQEILTGVFEFS